MWRREHVNRSLKNKVALVTGAGRGIGKEIAKTLASCGAFVIVNYNSSPDAAEQTVKEIIKQGGMAAPVQCDVSDFDACGKMMEMIINNYGHLDILVNNAGITRDGLIMKMSEEDFDRVLDTNLKGAFHTIRHASRYFLKQKSGKIINISSVSGVMGNAGQANLQCKQSRSDRSYQKCGKGACVERDHMQCSCTRIYRNRDDRGYAGGCQGNGKKSRFRFSGQGRCQMWPVWLHF